MTRIVAGSAGGRRIAVPPGSGTRPTTDRVREALFSSLGDLSGLSVLDLYAGSGAIGLEALSRGAGRVLLVESDRRAAEVIRANLRSLGLSGGTVVSQPVERVVSGRCLEAYDVVYADPPYLLGSDELRQVVADLVAHDWLAPDALIVVERDKRSPWTWPDGVVESRDRRYGEARLWYGHRS